MKQGKIVKERINIAYFKGFVNPSPEGFQVRD
jgi:hypothetical protein